MFVSRDKPVEVNTFVQFSQMEGAVQSFKLRNSILRAVGVTALLGVAACATLPAKEAEAFRELSTAQRDAFVGLTETERKALIAFAASARNASGSSWLTDNCGPDPAEQQDCIVTFRDSSGGHIKLTQAARNARAVIGGLAKYGGKMAELAEAQDIDTAREKTQAVGAAVKGLAAAVGVAVPFVGPVVDLAVFAESARLKEKRRRALLRAAQVAHPAVVVAADRLSEIARPLRGNIVLVSSQRVTGAAQQVSTLRQRQATLTRQRDGLGGGKVTSAWRAATIARLDSQIDKLDSDYNLAAHELVQASADLNVARSIETDFSDLEKAHSKLLDALQNPKISIEDALTDLTKFLEIMESLADAA